MFASARRTHTHLILRYIYRVTTSPVVAATIARWDPVSLPAEAVGFARAVVVTAAPGDPHRARALLWAAAKLAVFGASVGLDARAEVLLHPSVIERAAVIGAVDASPAARRTLRTNLRYLAARVVPELAYRPAPLSREHAKAPYTPAELADYLALADAQPTVARRMRLSALICLGAGAGLAGADLRAVRGRDVHRCCGGLIVEVTGRRGRRVPVRTEFHSRLEAAAGFAGPALLTGGVDQARRNLTTPLVSAIAGGADLPRLDVGRLRASWLTRCAEDLGLAGFMHAAGIVCSQRLGDLIANLGPVDEATMVALLGGRR
jgi:integrase